MGKTKEMSTDMRQKVISFLLKEKLYYGTIAKRLNLAKSTVQSIIKNVTTVEVSATSQDLVIQGRLKNELLGYLCRW